jgi:hypothetical protein
LKKIAMFAALVVLIALTLAQARANPDPVLVSWYVTNTSGDPINNARLTIYYATSTSGPWNIFPAGSGPPGNFTLDKVNGATTTPPGPEVYQNPIISGYWNPNHTAGMAVCDIHPSGGLNGLYFYVKIEYDSTTEYWPQPTSYKPGDPSWAPVVATSPSGYAAAGPSIGNGPTTAYPTHGPPPHVIPEVPMGPVMATVSMIAAFGVYFGLRKRKLQLRF